MTASFPRRAWCGQIVEFAALVCAAGGEVSDQRGGEDWLHGRNIVASNGLLHEDLRASLVPLEGS